MSSNEKKEYELINLGFEYPGMTGGIRWAVVTDLDISELEERYGDVLSIYKPYVVMTTEQGKVFHEYAQNEKKHDMRGIRHHDMFGYEEGLTEYLNSVFSKDEPEDAVVNKMRYEALVAAIDLLPDKQRRRCKMYFLMELTVDEIAEIEGITYQKVSESIIKAKGNLEKIEKNKVFLKGACKNASLCGYR